MSKHEVFSCDVCGETTNIKKLFGITLSTKVILCDPAAIRATRHICWRCVKDLRKDFDQLWVAKLLNKMEAEEAGE